MLRLKVGPSKQTKWLLSLDARQSKTRSLLSLSAVGKQAMKYPPTTLGGVAFTKKELESWAKRVLSSQNGLDNERNQRIAREAVATYDKVYEVGEGVERVYVAPHPEWGARGGFCFHVVFED